LSVFSTEVQPGRHPRHDVVEVVAVDLDELAILQGFQGLGRAVAREIAEDSHDEGELFLDHCPLGLHLVDDVNPGLAYA